MTASEFRKLALAQVGKRYVFGAEVILSKPSTWRRFDCSELTQALYYQAGVKLPDGSYVQYPETKPVTGSLKTGDLFFLKKNGRVHHVGVYIGNGEVVEAKGRLWGVVKTTTENVRGRGGIWRRHPKLNLTSAPAPAPKPKTLTVTVASLNMRSGPGLQFRRIHVLKQGEHVSPLRTSGAWRQVKHGEVTGWAHGRYLT